MEGAWPAGGDLCCHDGSCQELTDLFGAEVKEEGALIGIALGAASFLVLFWVDAASLRGIRFLKPILWLAGIGLFAAGLVLCLEDPRRTFFPAAVRIPAWALCALFAALLLYSLFIEIPFLSAYVEADRPARIVTRGTYALCRHPGVLWLAGLLAALFFASGSWVILIAIPVWVGLDALWVALQEKLFFVRMFGAAYEDYQRTVPFLIPTPRSAREFARTVFRNAPDE